MEQGEIETLVADLETRIDRLRALYDQYFMGIERLEPAVARKDVERKIQILRKEQIRNTGVRFRFQQLLHRYGTFQQHWHRITRQIENGTFRRHLLKAKSMFGTPAKGNERRPSTAPDDAVVSSIEVEVEVDFNDPVGSWSPPVGIPAVDETPTDREFRAADPVDALDEWGDPPTKVRAEPAPAPAPKPAPVAIRQAPAPAQPQTSLGRATLRSFAAPEGAGQTAAPPPIVLAPPLAPPRPAAATSPTGPRPHTFERPPPAPFESITPTLVPGRSQSLKPEPTLPKEGRVPVAAAPRVGPSQDRVRALYSELVETKRKLKESTAAITFDGLAKNLEESSAKLRAKHGRDVDFEVTIRDGKAMIKPVLK